MAIRCLIIKKECKPIFWKNEREDIFTLDVISKCPRWRSNQHHPGRVARNTPSWSRLGRCLGRDSWWARTSRIGSSGWYSQPGEGRRELLRTFRVYKKAGVKWGERKLDFVDLHCVHSLLLYRFSKNWIPKKSSSSLLLFVSSKSWLAVISKPKDAVSAASHNSSLIS